MSNELYRIVDEDDKYVDWKVKIIDSWYEKDGTQRCIVKDVNTSFTHGSIHSDNLIEIKEKT